MQYVQVVLTTDLVALLREGTSNLVVDPEGDPERAQTVRTLEHFLEQVAERPEAFPVTGTMANAIKSRLRKLKGPAQPASRKNKRKARQERRQSASKRRRQQRREEVAAFNAAREAYERDLAELREAQEAQQARVVELARTVEASPDLLEFTELIGLPLGPILEAARESAEA